MKKTGFILPLLVLALQLNGQGLVTGNSDVVGLTGYPYYMQLVKAGSNSFFWIGGAYFSNADHPLLADVVNDFPNIFFLKYDEKGNARYANYIRGSYIPSNAFSFDGGLTIVGSAYQNVQSNTGAQLPINNASQLEFLASYDDICQFVKMVPVWDLDPSLYVNSESAMDPSDGSIYLAGVSNQPLNVFGYGVIGADLGNFLYVLKFDRNLSLIHVFTAGVEAYGEYGHYNGNITLIPDGKGGVIVSGIYEGDRSPIIAGDTLTDIGFETQGTFAFKLGPAFGVEWIRDGKLEGFNYNGLTGILKGFPMRDGDLVLVGETTTGYFSLGSAEVKFENGADHRNQFVFRLSADGSVRWTRAFQSMGDAYGEQAKGTEVADRPRETESDQFTESFNLDAVQWNQKILYMTGTFLSDSFEVAGRKLEKPFYSGIYVAATDLETGKEKWGYAVSSDYMGLHGFGVGADGDVAVMGHSGSIKDYEFMGVDSVGDSQPVFILGLSYEGKPLWTNNATVPGQGYGGYGSDLLVLRDGGVFSSFSKSVQATLEIGGVPIVTPTPYSAILVALDAGSLLGGTLLTSSGATVVSGNIRAYKMSASGAYPMVDSVLVAQDGTYEFEGLYPGNYILLATPDRESYPDAVPTYSGGAVAWDEAKLVEIEADTRFRSHYIILADLPELTPEDGSGQMSGNVSYADEADLRKGTLGKPVTKTSVVLKRKAAQVKKSTLEDEIVAYVETDDQGNYVFENVPDGDYTLHVDITGLPYQAYNVVIVGNKIIYGLDFIVTEDEIEAINPVAVKERVASVFAVYPNPAKDVLHIDFPGTRSFSLRVYNSSGALVESRNLPNVSGSILINVSSWQEGMYLLDLEGPDGREAVKFVKR